MGLISRIKSHFRRRKEIRLSGLKAELGSFKDVGTQYIDPYMIAKLNRKIAILEEELK